MNVTHLQQAEGSAVIAESERGRSIVTDTLRQTRAIFTHLAAHSREERRPGYYATMAVFLGAMLAANYLSSPSLEERVAHGAGAYRLPATFALYAGVYAFGVAMHVAFHRRTEFLRRPGFWAISGFAIASYATYARFDHHVGWLRAHVPPELRAHVLRCAANLIPACWGALAVVLIWSLFARGARQRYGLALGDAKLKGYAALLAISLPVVVIASFQPDFLAVYPRFRASPASGTSTWQLISSFELCYGADFFFTELFFRGLFVIGMARWLGFGAVLPMVAFYMTIHFGKPFGEALLSVFGGWVLGVIAYRTRSIWGGVLFHLGFAYALEAAAMWQKWRG